MNKPASTCPYCLKEGWPYHDQLARGNWDNSDKPLVDAIRFTCPNDHIWQTDAEWAELQGAFLDRQRAV